MNRSRCAAITHLAFLMLLSGCYIPLGVAPAGGTDQDPTAAEQTAMAHALEETLTAMANSAPLNPLVPTLTLTIASEIPLVSVTTETFCRSGPGEPYEILGNLKVGQSAEVVGRNAYGDTWIIILPTTPPITCWMWGGYATLTGNDAEVPVVSPPPTPTPQANFSFTFQYLVHVIGSHCMVFTINNTGGTTWESYSLNVDNLTQGVSGSKVSSVFIDYSDLCSVMDSQGDLAPGESSTAIAVMHMPLAPAGNHFDATLILCSGDNSTGTCLTKTISYTP